MNFEELLTFSVTAFILTFSRLGAAAMIMPGIGDSFVSTRIRLLIALSLSFMLTPVAMQYMPSPLPSGFSLYLLIMMELIIGLFIGTIMRVFMAALDTAGMVASFSSGLGNAQVFNPSFAAQGSLLGSFLSITGVVVLFASDLYLILIYGLVDCYKIFPVGGMPAAGDMAQVFTKAVSASFLIGIKIATPFIIIALCLYVGMGVLARLIPQVQVFILSLPILILLSILTMSLILSSAMMFWMRQFQDNMAYFFSM